MLWWLQHPNTQVPRVPGGQSCGKEEGGQKTVGDPEDQVPMFSCHRGGIEDFSIQIVIR